MRKQVEHVTTQMKVEDASRLIFGHGINGVPVVAGKKLVGFITERDILSKFLPTMQEYVEDPVHNINFEDMEKKSLGILSLTTEQVMSKNPIAVKAETPLLKAQSIMSLRKIGRLPVIDKNGNLIGILTKSDIFRILVGKQMSLEKEEGFYDWLAKYYDTLILWEKRLNNEIPDLIRLFKSNKVKRIVDIAFGTGEHAISLAKNSFEVFGLESSGLMLKIAEQKKSKLGKNVGHKLSFLKGEYKNLLKNLPGEFDAIIFMGNSFPHVIEADKNILSETEALLGKKNSIMVFQILNLEKIFKVKEGLREFSLREADSNNSKHAFLSFYTKSNKNIIVARSVFEFSNSKWLFKGMHSKPVIEITMEKLDVMLKKNGFSDIQYYGGSFYGHLFREPFRPLESDWLNVVARR